MKPEVHFHLMIQRVGTLHLSADAIAVPSNEGTLLEATLSSFDPPAPPRAPAAQKPYRNGEGETVIDPARGLMWSARIIRFDRVDWKSADEACRNFRLSGFEDWRLPTREELQSLVDYDRFNPAINPELFPDTPASYFWSSSPDASDPGCAWVVYFYYGYVALSYRNDAAFVRAVRSLPASQ